MHFTEYATRVAAYALIVDGDRVLLTWYNGTGTGDACWSLPGGGIEYEEDLVEGLAREVYEETGHFAAVGRPLTTSMHIGDGPDGRPWKAVKVIFDATITGGTLGTTEVGGTTDRAEWVPIAEVGLAEPVADVVVQALRARDATLEA